MTIDASDLERARTLAYQLNDGADHCTLILQLTDEVVRLHALATEQGRQAERLREDKYELEMKIERLKAVMMEATEGLDDNDWGVRPVIAKLREATK